MTILVNDLERNNSLANENLGRLLPQSERNDSNYYNNSINNDNINYENPKIYKNEYDISKKYNEKDDENIQIKSRDDFTSLTNNGKQRYYYDRDDDDDNDDYNDNNNRNYNNHETNIQFIEKLLGKNEDISHSKNKKSEKIQCSSCKEKRPIFIILIQIGIIIFLFMLGFATGLTKYFKLKNDSVSYLFMAAQVFQILMSLFYIIYFFNLQKEMESKWWYIYLIPFIPIFLIYSFFLFGGFDSDWQVIITIFLVVIFALLAALILKGKRPRLLIVLLLLSSAIVLIPSLLIFEATGAKLYSLIVFSSIFDFYLWIIYCLSGGLYDTDDIIHDVAFFDYGFYLIPCFFIYFLFIYPCIFLGKCCYLFFANDDE